MYILEGNIGVGKSTFLSEVKKRIPEIKVLTEPVNNWTNQIFGQSLLENFYKDANRWAYTLENLAMIHRVKDHLEVQKENNLVLMERSIYSGHYCFAKNSYKSGFLSDVEWKIYDSWGKFLLKSCRAPKGFVYLKANPEICLARIKKRNRLSEKQITLKYVKQIDSWHDKFLIKKEDIPESIKNIPVLELNFNNDFEKNKDILNDHIEKLRAFIKKYS